MKAEASLVGWLYRATRFAARDLYRNETRRTERERLAMEQLQPESESTPDWNQLSASLDDAMSDLDELDREIVLLRYFKNHDLRTVGAALGISDDAAQKRVSRAVERLREIFAKRGIAVGASGLVVAISANAIQAAPAGLALAISTAATLTGPTLATITATKAIAMTALQKTLVSATMVALATTAVYQTKQAKDARAESHAVRQQQSLLAKESRQLQNDLADATNRVAELAGENAQFRSMPNQNELLKLRDETTRLRADAKELARIKSLLSEMSEQQSEALKTMRESIKRDLFKQWEQQAKAMQKRLSLTIEQTDALKSIWNSSTERVTQSIIEMRMGEWTQEKQNKMNEWGQEQESQIVALLSPQQKAEYWQLQKEKAEADTRRSANDNSQINNLRSELNISAEQAEAVLIAVSKASMATDASGVMHSQPPDYLGPNTSNEELQQRVEKQAQALISVLTPEQLKRYREGELKKLIMARDNLAKDNAMMQLLKSTGK